jgi:hypothetical protein
MAGVSRVQIQRQKKSANREIHGFERGRPPEMDAALASGGKGQGMADDGSIAGDRTLDRQARRHGRRRPA